MELKVLCRLLQAGQLPGASPTAWAADEQETLPPPCLEAGSRRWASTAVSKEPDPPRLHGPVSSRGGREGGRDSRTLFIRYSPLERAWPSWASLLPDVHLLIAPPWGPGFQHRNLGNTDWYACPSSDVEAWNGENQEALSKQVRVKQMRSGVARGKPELVTLGEDMGSPQQRAPSLSPTPSQPPFGFRSLLSTHSV